MAETAIQIERDIEELSSLRKFDDFLKLANFYHYERCENIDCSNCLFLINLRYLYVQTAVLEHDSVATLQKFCRIKHVIFHSIRLLQHFLAAFERERLRLDRKFHRTLAVWNKPPPQNTSANTQQ